LRLSERRATNPGLLYPKVRNNIGWIFPLTSPQPKYWGDVSPASPAGLTPVAWRVLARRGLQAVPLPRKYMNFSSQNGVIGCILGVLFLRFTCLMDCSCMINFIEVPLCTAEGGKNKTLVKILGGRQHRTTPAGQILGVTTPATPAALSPMAATAINHHHHRHF